MHKLKKWLLTFGRLGMGLILGLLQIVSPIAMAHEWMAPKEAAQRENPVAADKASLARGQNLYGQLCAYCHGSSGRGDGPLAANLTPKPANLVQRAPTHSDGDLAWKIETGKGAMPAFRDTLSGTQIWELVNYIRSLE